MSRLATSFVLGYHGCDASVARQAVLEGGDILQSDRDFDWLGPGAYFWESDPVRAMEWALWKKRIGSYAEPAVVGAVIELRNCLDLMSREDIELFRAAYASYIELQQKAGLEIPINRNPNGADNNDRALRFLDCAVFRHLHSMINAADLEPFDSVRGMFVEGERIYPGCGLFSKTHVQIAVRNPECIKGIFYPSRSSFMPAYDDFLPANDAGREEVA